MAAEKSPFARFLTHFDTGTILFEEGDGGDEMYIIQSGKVSIKKKVGAGETLLAVLEKGDFFGEMSILERQPRSAKAEMTEEGDLIVINGETFGDMIKTNPEIAVRMLRKYSIRLRDTNKQLELAMSRMGQTTAMAQLQEQPAAAPPAEPGGSLQAEAKAYFISPTTGNVYPVFSNDALIGRFDSVTGHRPEVDLTAEDQSRNISRRHARCVFRDGRFWIMEEIGTMNGTFLNGKKLQNGVLVPVEDGDELVLCRLAVHFKLPTTR